MMRILSLIELHYALRNTNAKYIALFSADEFKKCKVSYNLVKKFRYNMYCYCNVLQSNEF
jgi:hypothetical protein